MSKGSNPNVALEPTSQNERHVIQGGRADLEGDVPVAYQEERFFRIFSATIRDGGLGKPFGPGSFTLEGPLDLAALENAINAFLFRHRVLWSRFREVEGQVFRCLERPTRTPLRTVDLRHLSGKAQMDGLVHDIAANQHSCDDLTSPPPRFSTTLYRLKDDSHVLECVSTLGVFDYVSGNIFAKELGDFYRRYSAGEKPQVVPAAVQFADYACWNRDWHTGPRVEKAVAFFRQRLEGGESISSLMPTDSPREPVELRRKQNFYAPFPQKGVFVKVAPEVTGTLRGLAESGGWTLEAATYAAFAAAMGRRAGVSDVVMRTTFDTRDRLTGIEDTVGFFSNFTYLRLDLSGAPTFRQLVARGHREVSEARSLPEFQLVPFAYPEVDDRFRVLFMHYGTRGGDGDRPELPGIKVGLLEFGDEYRALFFWPLHWQDWSVGFFEMPNGGLGVRVLCNTALWNEATGRSLANDVVHILERGAAAPDAPLPAVAAP